MSVYFAELMSQQAFAIVFGALAAAAVAYTLASFQDNWLLGFLLFPGLYFGALAAVKLARDTAIISGHDQENAIIMITFGGILAALIGYYTLYLCLRGMNSYSRSAHRAILERTGQKG